MKWVNRKKTWGICNSQRISIPVRKQNIDYTDPAVVQAANVRSVPTVILVENGQEVKRFTGVKSYNQIIDWLNYGN